MAKKQTSRRILPTSITAPSAPARKAVQDELRPMWVTWGQQRWQGSARRFEDYGTRNLAAVLALGDAMDFHHHLGSEAKEMRLKALWQYFLQKAQASNSVIWRLPKTGSWHARFMQSK